MVNPDANGHTKILKHRKYSEKRKKSKTSWKPIRILKPKYNRSCGPVFTISLPRWGAIRASALPLIMPQVKVLTGHRLLRIARKDHLFERVQSRKSQKNSREYRVAKEVWEAVVTTYQDPRFLLTLAVPLAPALR